MLRFLLGLFTLIPALILLLPVFVVAGGLMFVSAAVRSLARLLEPRYVPWADLMTYDSQLGWRPRPGLDVHYLANADDVYRLVTDAEGWPGADMSVADSDVVVIGDSFAFGYGVDSGRSFATGNPGLAIKCVGAPAYSLVQGVLLMEQLASRLSGKLVVWFVCLENDLQDAVTPGVWRYRMPFVRRRSAQGDWEIVTEHVVPTVWQSPDWSWKRTLPYLCVESPMSARVYEGCEYLVRRAAVACERAGAHLAILTIPDLSQLTDSGRVTLAAKSGTPEAFDADLPDRRFGEICQRHDVLLVRGKDHLSAADYKRWERLHWNERGHRKVSRLLTGLHDSFRRGEISRACATVSPVGHDSAVGQARVLAR
jgi:hypothetical protein